MTDGGLTMTEAWNLQLRGRVERLETTLLAVQKTCNTDASSKWRFERIEDLVRRALETNNPDTPESSDG